MAAFWLALYFVLNLLLTLYNKVVLIHFPFPYTLTALHALCGSVGTFLLLHWPVLSARLAALARCQPPERKRHPEFASPILPPVPTVHGKEIVVVLLFSVLYTVNIVVSNASLRLVTVPFHQCVRASAPLFTIALSALLLGQYSSRAKLIALIPVIAGVAFATYGDYYFTPHGFFLTLLGTLLAALKTIITNLLQKPHTLSRLKSTLIEKAVYPRLSISGTFKLPHPEKPSRFRDTNESSSAHTSDSDPDPDASSSDLQRRPLLRSFVPGPTDDDSGPTPPSAHHFVLPSPSTKSPSAFHYSSVSTLCNRIRLSLRVPSLFLSNCFDLPKLTLSPLQLLYLLSPLAFIQTTLLAHFSGELERVSVHLYTVSMDFQARSAAAAALATDADVGIGSSWSGGGFGIGGGLGSLVGIGLQGGIGGAPRLWLLLNGVLAFALNVVSFNANRKVGALGMSVAANVKQVLAVLCSVTLFNLTITHANGVGIFLTLLGGAWYAAVELREKKMMRRRVLQPQPVTARSAHASHV